MTRNLRDVNAVEARRQLAFCTAEYRSRVSGLPPHSFLLDQTVGGVALHRPLGRIGQLLVATLDDNAHPVLRVDHLVNLDADQGVGAHPLDLLSDHRKAIEVIIVVGELERHDVRLVPACAR